jgi:mRNA-degrading endonuclease YafQ of YafQ-DinJ toxin-antitoxin module
MFTLIPSSKFTRELKKLVKSQKKLRAKIDKVFDKLSDNPQDPKLGSHKVHLTVYGEVWSSAVTGDIRIIWNYNQNGEIEIILINIGGHDKVYR